MSSSHIRSLFINSIITGTNSPWLVLIIITMFYIIIGVKISHIIIVLGRYISRITQPDRGARVGKDDDAFPRVRVR